MNAVWRWLLGSLMKTNTYCHCRKGNVWICPKVRGGFFCPSQWEGFFPMASPSLLHQNRSSCPAGFKRAERVKGRRSSLYISFLSIRHWWGLCTITSYLNTSWQSGVLQTLPAPWCIAEMCCSPLDIVWIHLQVSSPPNIHRPPWQQSHLWQLQIPHPRFFLCFPPPVAGGGKDGMVNNYPSHPQGLGGLANHKGLSPAQAHAMSGINGAPDCLMEFFFPTEQNIN